MTHQKERTVIVIVRLYMPFKRRHELEASNTSICGNHTRICVSKLCFTVGVQEDKRGGMWVRMGEPQANAGRPGQMVSLDALRASFAMIPS